MEDETMKLGLLMEAAQAQQTVAASALDRLRDHTAGLDAIVREEIRTTLLEEMRALADDTRGAAASLRRLQRITSLRVTACALLVPSVVTLVPFALAWWFLPSPAEIRSLTAQRDALAVNITRLSAQGGKVELRRCGRPQRLCVHVERSAPAYGTAGDFLVVKGY